MSHSHGFLARMLDQLAPHRVRAPGLSEDVVDELCRLEVVSATEARLLLPHKQGVVAIERPTRQYADAHPNAVWVADLRVSDATGTLTPFSPPRIEKLDASVPVRVDDDLRGRLAELGLPRDGDLLRGLTVPAGRDQVAILGMRAVAALDAEDARRVTWWVPGGGALELRVEDDGAGGTALALVEVVKESDARKANSGPNVLVTLLRGAALPLVGRGEGKGPPRAAVPVFHPARSKLFDAWARYTAVDQQERKDRETERGKHPIAYTDATQKGWLWRATARLSPEQLEAWIGPEAAEGREIRVDQPAAVVEGEADVARGTIEVLVLRGPGQAELHLRADRGVARIPASGTLAARANKGEEVRLGRERAALETLGKGAAACPTLPLLLGTPEAATPPETVPLRPAAVAALDPHQEAAVRAIVGCRDLVAIQGPPGTGKTGVIAEALRQIAAKGRREGRTYKVLVSSVQNEAITNLLQRLAGVEGVLVYVVERAARDEEEGFRFARRMEDQRERAVKRLDDRLARSEIAGRLARMREATDALGEVQTLAAAGPNAWPRLARRLQELADDRDAPLGEFDRDEARALAGALEAAASGPAAPAAPRTSARPPGPPAALEDVPAWWDRAGAAWPVAHHAEVGAAVSGIATALRIEAPAARRLILDRAAPRLRAAVDATRWPEAAQCAPAGISVEDQLDAWLATAARHARDAEAAIVGSPDAVAWRFLRAMREDPPAWARIVERHGNAVAATCSMAAKAQPDPSEPYEWVIIDEAGRATPFELLIPMVQGRRIVLIGDHRQLPPMFDDAVARRATDDDGAPLELDGLTLFGELFRLLPHENALRLGTQYRMHEAIGGMVDAIFYRPNQEGLLSHYVGDRVSEKWLVEVDTPEGRRKVARSRGEFRDAPVVWHDVAARRSCAEENPDEAEVVVALLEKYAKAGVEPDDIAVICPYRRQRAVLERALRKSPEAQRIAQIRTIDAVQGREYAIVLLCLVRTDGRPGFLASPNRLNVAISRAQRQLVFVGTASAFLRADRVRERAPHLHRVITEALRLDQARKELP